MCVLYQNIANIACRFEATVVMYKSANGVSKNLDTDVIEGFVSLRGYAV